ncbi:hypothetical protein [Nocardia sp. NPDC019395]|uniref:hypothetical protein n=1 Tax=Nocardia sp. NPDC019395 TaxID=3154686 RepID=UPI0033FB9581
MTLAEVAADLYGRAPGEFVAARDEQARAARRAGDKALGAEIAALRKPTVAAWVVNMLVRAAPGEVEALLLLGDDLRTAQRELSGEQLRLLTRQRRQVVDALAERARTVAAQYGQQVTDAVLRQVGETLTAALADPEVAGKVRTATLASAASYAGFGPVEPGLTVVRETTDSAATQSSSSAPAVPAKRPVSGRTDDDESRERVRQEELRAARDRAQAISDAAEAEARQAGEDLRRSEERLAQLRAELVAAEDRLRFARNAERAARRAFRAATTELERARRRLE